MTTIVWRSFNGCTAPCLIPFILLMVHTYHDNNSMTQLQYYVIRYPVWFPSSYWWFIPVMTTIVWHSFNITLHGTLSDSLHPTDGSYLSWQQLYDTASILRYMVPCLIPFILLMVHTCHDNNSMTQLQYYVIRFPVWFLSSYWRPTPVMTTIAWHSFNITLYGSLSDSFHPTDGPHLSWYDNNSMTQLQYYVIQQ